MAPPRPATFERPDLEHKRTFIKHPLPRIWRQGFLPEWEFRNRITKAEQFWRMAYRLNVEKNDTEDEQWQPHALLGQGSFGSVGVWKKRDPESGAVVDELAIKTIHCKTRREMVSSLWGRSPDCRGLLAEAVIQRQLNDSACENIVHLRGYRYFFQHPDDPPRPGPPVALDKEFKLYLEYAPYDTLDSLRLKYRYHHQYLPEAFLWHVFNSLAFAAATMRQCPQEGLPYPNAEEAPKGQHTSLIHFDLKLENIFLGYREPYGADDHRGGTKVYDYPIIKLGDFGLMSFVNQDNDQSQARHKNPRDWLSVGTPARRAPELVHYGAYWPRSPNGPYIGANHYKNSPFIRFTGSPWPTLDKSVIDDPQNLEFRLSEKVDVWAIGKVMFDLMGLHNPTKLWRMTTSQHDRYQRYGNHMIPNFDRAPFVKYASGRTSPYSRSLARLVADCLQPSIAARMNVTTLLAQTNSWMSHWDQHHARYETLPRVPGDTRPSKLFWRANEINQMPEGGENFPMRFKEYVKMQQRVRSDPDWPRLRPPFDRQMGPPYNCTHDDLYSQKYLRHDWRKYRKNFENTVGHVRLKASDDNDRGPDDSDLPSPVDESADSEDDYYKYNDGRHSERDGRDSDENDPAGQADQDDQGDEGNGVVGGDGGNKGDDDDEDDGGVPLITRLRIGVPLPENHDQSDGSNRYNMQKGATV